jgi:sulfate adenylyltransferase subunit 2
MANLDSLETRSVSVLREAFNRVDRLAMPWSIDRDSNVMLWLVRETFLGHASVPVIPADIACKLPETVAFHDKFAEKWRLGPIIASNGQAPRVDGYM